jgi:hypothetical protein
MGKQDAGLTIIAICLPFLEKMVWAGKERAVALASAAVICRGTPGCRE